MAEPIDAAASTLTAPAPSDVAAVVSASTPPFFPPGPITRLLTWVEALGWRSWLVYAALVVGTVAWVHAILWATGRLPLGTFDANISTLWPYTPYGFVMLTLGRRIAARSVATFWPATGWPESSRPNWTYQFLAMPTRLEALAIVVGVVVAVGGMLGTPTAMLGPEVDRVATYAAYAPLYIFGYTASAILIITASRWVVLVARMHRHADAIDPFDRAPIYAFSRLTAFIGIAVFIADSYSFTVNGVAQAGNLAALSFGIISTALGVVAFIAPLWGIHDRLVHLKERLMVDVERRITRAGAEMYARVDDGAFAETKVVADSLGGLGVIRERISKLPTWPWHPQLFRGFLSALLVPIIVYVLSRAIGGTFSL